MGEDEDVVVDAINELRKEVARQTAELKRIAKVLEDGYGEIGEVIAAIKGEG